MRGNLRLVRQVLRQNCGTIALGSIEGSEVIHTDGNRETRAGREIGARRWALGGITDGGSSDVRLRSESEGTDSDTAAPRCHDSTTAAAARASAGIWDPVAAHASPRVVNLFVSIRCSCP